MKKSPVAAIALSMLVYPGTGHFLFKRWVRGVSWAVVFSVVLFSVMAVMGVTLSQMSTQIMSPTGDVEFDLRQLALGAALGLATCLVWGLAAADAWWVSRQTPAVTEAPGLTPEAG